MLEMLETNIMLPRENGIELLMNHIEAGNCAFIFGLPFIGKTVLAHNIIEKLKAKDEMLPIYIDLKEFEGDTTDTVFNSIILKFGKVLHGGGEHSIPEKGNREYHLKKLLRYLPGKKAVILLDSAEGIKKLSDWDIFLHTIRALHVESRVVFFLFSRIRPQGFAENPVCSSAINIFEANLIKLNLLPKDVVDTLSEYLVSKGIEVEPVLPDFIWKHTGGHPFSIKTYMDIYRAEKRKYPFLDEQDFNSIEEKAEAKLQGFYRELFEMLGPRHHQIIAGDVLDGKISKNRDKFLRDLRELGILRQSDEGYQLFSTGAEKFFQENLKKRKISRMNEKKKERSGQSFMRPVKRILILAANPKTTPRLRLDEEVREIKEGLQRSKYREQFELRSEWAIRLRDLRRALLDFKPHIVHFTGHGTEDDLMVEDELGFAVPISSEALSGLFELFSNRLECVILSACYSAQQANAISRHINYVIGMRGEFNDKAAIEFAVGFYDALGAGESVEEAFKFGCNAILASFPEHLIPVLKIGLGIR